MRQRIVVEAEIEYDGLACGEQCPQQGENHWCNLFSMSVYARVQVPGSHRVRRKRCIRCVQATDQEDLRHG